MKQISKEYLLLFNAITDTERRLSQLRTDLISIQQRAEELFLDTSASAQDALDSSAPPDPPLH